MPGIKISNQYANLVEAVYSDIPKAVFAAIAVSALTNGGDDFQGIDATLIKEWHVLHLNEIVPQPVPGPLKKWYHGVTGESLDGGNQDSREAP